MKFNEEQMKILSSIGYDVPEDLTLIEDEILVRIEDEISDLLMDHTDDDYEPDGIGRVCESILDLLSED